MNQAALSILTLNRRASDGGLIIHAEKFLGWESLGAMAGHFRFVRDHHRKLTHVALVTDASIAGIAGRLAVQFVAARIWHFGFDQLTAARDWSLNPGEACATVLPCVIRNQKEVRHA